MPASASTPGPRQPPQTLTHTLRQAIATILLALALVATGLTLVWPNISSLRCDRLSTGAVNCQLRGFSLIGLPTRSRQIRPLLGAQLNLANATRPGYVYRVMLADPQKEIPLGLAAAPYTYANATLQRIDRFIKNPQSQSLHLIYPLSLGPLVTLLLGTLGLAIAGLILWQIP